MPSPHPLPAALAALIDQTEPDHPRVAGHTVEVHRLAALRQGGMTVAQIVADYPGLTAVQVEAAVAYAQYHPWTGPPFPRETIKQVLRAGGLDALWPDDTYEREHEALGQAFAEAVARRQQDLAHWESDDVGTPIFHWRAQAQDEDNYGYDEAAWEREQEAAWAEQQVRRERALSNLTWNPAFFDLGDPAHPCLVAPPVDLATLAALHAGGATVAQIQNHWPAYSTEAIESALAYVKAKRA